MTAYVLQDQSTKRFYTANYQRGPGIKGWSDNLASAQWHWSVSAAQYTLDNGHGFRGEKNALTKANTKIVPLTIVVGTPL